METQRKKQAEAVFTETSGGFVIALRDNSFIGSK